MHVLVAAHDLYPDAGSGGTGRYVYETGRRLVERGHRVTVVTRRRGSEPTRGSVAGMNVYRYDVRVADQSWPTVVRQLPNAARAVASAVESAGRPDVFSVQGHVIGLLCDRVVPDDVRRVPTFHSPWSVEYRLRTRNADRSPVRRRLNAELRRGLERRLLARSDQVVTLSAFMRERLRETQPRLDVSVDVVPGGVDAERFSPDARPHPAMDASGTRFLTVRRLSPRMGHALLLEAFARATDGPDDGESPHLYVAGDGPLRELLERRAHDLGLGDCVTFLGYIPDADLPGAYAAADAFVLPTTELEGFGLATLEALAAGTPVLGTAVGGTVELLSGLRDRSAMPSPVLVSPERDALAAGLREWMAADADALAAAGCAAREYVCEQYPWSRTVDALVGAYKREAPGTPITPV
ncbi:glycosyltransferase family 4 protein [Halobacterium zhouii]|uniref:glycosyltransferase family 4 protein n=1 Tax=Halobacterium zhouii TaxID=2902624 RepID=UPI001E41942A|nr:glycosyltransferase family 4 protein [Halobacterium zhouii]